MAESEATQIGLDIFSEFLEVAIHSILYNRELYPAGVFERRKKYNVPVQICVHPEVNQYITQVSIHVHLNSKIQCMKVLKCGKPRIIYIYGLCENVLDNMFLNT